MLDGLTSPGCLRTASTGGLAGGCPLTAQWNEHPLGGGTATPELYTAAVNVSLVLAARLLWAVAIATGHGSTILPGSDPFRRGKFDTGFSPALDFTDDTDPTSYSTRILKADQVAPDGQVAAADPKEVPAVHSYSLPH